MSERTPAPTVSVVICAFADDRWSDLRAAVGSVLAQAPEPAEVIVVVDHNRALAKRARDGLAGALVLENGGTRGAGEARNVGARAARGAILAFLDDDARAAPGWLARGARAFADARVMGVGGTIEPAWDLGAPSWFPAEFNWTVGCTYPGLPTTPTPVRNLIAANMFVRRSVFERIGGFRAGFGKQGQRSRPEETELCLRANQRWPDGVWLYDPGVTVRHRVPPSRGRPRYFVSRCYNEGRGKAALVGYAGPREGLAAERAYTRRTLPAGAARGLADALTGRDRSGPLRSAAIAAGLAVTALGYVQGRVWEQS